MCSDSLDRHQAASAEVSLSQSLWEALLWADDVQFDWTDPGQAPTVSMSMVRENPEGTIAYPWDPTDPGSEAFFNQLEERSQATLQGWDQAEFSSRAQTFFTQLDQLWAATDTQTKLAQRFGSRIPPSTTGNDYPQCPPDGKSSCLPGRQTGAVCARLNPRNGCR